MNATIAAPTAVQMTLHEVLFPLRGSDCCGWHSQLGTLFPDLKRAEAMALYRVEGTVARVRSVLPFVRSRQQVRLEIAEGAEYAFKLRANTIKAQRQEDGRKSRDVPDHDWDGWLDRHRPGFEVVSLWMRQAPKAVGSRDGRLMTHTGVDYEGVLRCTDPMALAQAVAHGVGSAKCWGFGMLMLEAL